jgi:hypothetical protein
MSKERINQFREKYAARMGWCRNRECLGLWQRKVPTALCAMCLKFYVRIFGGSNG